MNIDIQNNYIQSWETSDTEAAIKSLRKTEIWKISFCLWAS